MSAEPTSPSSAAKSAASSGHSASKVPTTSISSAASATSSKLLPAPAPLVSAWGSKSTTNSASASATSTTITSPSVSTTNTSQIVSKTHPKSLAENSNAKDQWPSAADTVLSKSTKDPSAAAVSKVSSLQNKPVKSTGKEKWVPYEATIVISSSSNGNNSKKKTGGNGNNNSNGNNQAKKKPQNNKSEGNGKDQRKKNQQGTGSENKQRRGSSNNNRSKDVTESLSGLTLDSSSTFNSKSTTLTSPPSKLINTATTAATEVSDSQADSLNKGAHTANTTENSDKTGTQESSPAPPQIHGKDALLNQGNHKQQSYYNNNNNNNNGKKYRHRNTDPYNQSFQSGYNSKTRHYTQPYNNNYRNSFAGPSAYPASPYTVNPAYPNYGYNPAFVPNQGYVNNYNYPSLAPSPLQFPNKDEFPVLNQQQIDPSLGGLPFIPNPMLYSYAEDPLRLVVNQLNYYFSIDNLVKDLYLRKQMNSEGFVPLKTLIQFNRLKTLTGGDLTVLLNALAYTPLLESSNEKVRLRSNWKSWVLPYEQRDASGKEEEDEGGDEIDYTVDESNNKEGN